MSISNPSNSVSRTEPLDDVAQAHLYPLLDAPSKITWSLSEQIANNLVEEIIRGTFAPGQQLQEVAIAKRFGVSRGPVREAFRIVEKEGLLHIRPRYGAFVAKLSAENVTEIFEVRALLLAFAARRIAERHDDDVLAHLNEGANGLRASVDNVERFLPLVYQFSLYVTAKIGNDLAKGILLSLARQTLHLTRIALLNKANRQLWIENWTKMVEAIARDEPLTAEAAMRNLVENVRDAVLRILAEMQDNHTVKAERHV